MNTIIQFFKQNSGAIIFFIVIIFAVGSIYAQNQNSTRQVRQLMLYSLNSIEYINSTYAELVTTTLPMINSKENYEIVINKLEEFSTWHDSSITSLPRDPRDKDSLAFRDEMTQFLRSSKQTIDSLIERQRLLLEQKDEIDVIFEFIQSDASNNSEFDIQYQSVLNTIQSLVQNVEKHVDSQYYSYVTQIYIKPYSTLREIASSIESNPTNISIRDTHDRLQEYISINPGYPIISNSDLKNEMFTRHIDEIQKKTEVLEQQYSL